MIPLPLKHYDEAGTVLPPRWLYWMLAIACRDLLLVAAFTAIPAESDRLYRIFFPHSDVLWLQIAVTPLVQSAGTPVCFEARAAGRGYLMALSMVDGGLGTAGEWARTLD